MGLSRRAILSSSLALFCLADPIAAGVLFENCVSGPDGALSCDTRPTGDTLLDDEAARYGLFEQASPGWAEYDPYAADQQLLGGDGW